MPRRFGHTKSAKPWERRRFLSRNRRRQMGQKRESNRARNPKPSKEG